MAALAGGQFGVVARRQLLLLGVSARQVRSWVAAGYLLRRLPGVYAVGHGARSVEGDLAAALLYAGPGAMLSHGTAAWWLRLTDRRPPLIQLATPRRPRPAGGLEIHGRRDVDRVWHRDLPVAPIHQVLLDYAATHGHDDIRYVLAQAEYRRLLDPSAVKPHLGRGRPGSVALRRALRRHEPQLARTRSELERRMLLLCERFGLPVPEFNVYLHGHLVDAVWREQRVIVETDGEGAHGQWGQIRADHHHDLSHRAAGFVVLRYTWDQLDHEQPAVAADIRRALRM